MLWPIAWPISCKCSLLDSLLVSCCLYVDLLNTNCRPMMHSSSGKGMGRVYGKFHVQVPMGTKVYLLKKEKEKKKKKYEL